MPSNLINENKKLKIIAENIAREKNIFKLFPKLLAIQNNVIMTNKTINLYLKKVKTYVIVWQHRATRSPKCLLRY